MRAAIYSRFSSENQREQSIEGQNRNCEAHAKRQGWKIVERYADKAISGSTAERPGYQQMLRDAKAKHFTVLLVDDLSRLTRDEAELIKTRKLLVFWEVRLIGISDGFDTSQKGHKIQASFHGIKNEMYIDELRDKTIRGLTCQALEGNNCGGRNYGYRHIPIEHPTERDALGRPKILAVRREIDPEQARWVRQIFEWYAEGNSPRYIADALNQRQVPSPGASYRRRNPCARYGTWSASVLHGELDRATGILANPIYVGKLIWNRRKWVRDPETERKLPKLRPESEWIVVDRPDLRIIPQALWDRVQARRKMPKKWTAVRPRSPKYLLSSLLKCSVCESNFVMQDYYRYGCAGHKDRGQTVCHNSLRVSRAVAEEKVLAGIRRDLFNEEGLSLFIKETTKLLTERRRQQPPDRRLKQVDEEIANIMAAIKAGIFTPTTKAALEKAETERARLQRTITETPDTVVSILPRTKERYQAVLEGIGTLPANHLPQAREQLRTLVGDIWLKPTPEGHLVATLTGRYDGLVNLVSGKKLNLGGCGERI